ncbi:hypothetical protein G9A89_013546 [Geosiphon pyriformis]|nr:hypothetical protein G9A89_013546 [Geosiphon pyriformis]
MTAYDLGTLLERTSGKTYVINYSVKTGNKICCAVIGFEFKVDLESAYCIEPLFGDVKLSWTKMNLVQCEHCEKFGHFVLKCDVTITSTPKPFKPFKKSTLEKNCLRLAKLYAKKNVPISCPAAFGGRSWAQVVLATSIFYDYSTGAGSGFFSIFGLDSDGKHPSFISINSSLDAHLLILKCFLKLLSNQMLDIVKCPLVSVSQSFIPVLSAVVNSSADLDMVLDVLNTCSAPSFPVVDDALVLSSNSMRVLTSKVGSLESKLVALEASVGSVLGKLDLLCAGSETKSRPSIRPWIINKFEGVRIFSSGLDKGFLGTGVAVIINNFLAYYVSKVEEVPDHLISVWGTLKVINFIFVSSNLASAVVSHIVDNVSEFFDIDHKLISVSVGLGGLLDTYFNNACKQANRNWWKFKLENTNKAQWVHFKELFLAGLLTYSNEFHEVKNNSNLNAMWKALRKILVHATDMLFILRIVKAFGSGDLLKSDWLVKIWSAVDNDEAFKFTRLVLNGAGLLELLRHLSIVKKRYWKSKYYESRAFKDATIKKAIDHHMENFCSNKEKIIKSVVLDHLVVDDELVIEPNKVKLKVNEIMEEWTRKQSMLLQMSDLWSCQYMPLNYVDDNAFSGVIKEIDMKELSLVVGNLPNKKAAGLLGIPNEL